MDRWQARMALLLVLVAPISGCKTGVRDFADMNDPAPFVRARAAGLSDSVSDARAIPALIEHLEDVDPVVRLSSHEELRQRTGQDFGYLPYEAPDERAAAVARWRQWWESQSVSPSGNWLGPGRGRAPRQ